MSLANHDPLPHASRSRTMLCMTWGNRARGLHQASRVLPIGLMALVVGSCSACSDDPSKPPAGAPGIEIHPAATTFGPKGAVALNVTIRNLSTTSCLMSDAPTGVLTIVEMTRDGAAVIPNESGANWIGGFHSFYGAHLRPVAPGDSLSLNWTSNDGEMLPRSLKVHTAAALDHTDTREYPIAAPGRYELTVRYLAPSIPDLSGELCRVSGYAKVEFVVKGS
jgi:hypothetical protein